jgi:hypothetical protein
LDIITNDLKIVLLDILNAGINRKIILYFTTSKYLQMTDRGGLLEKHKVNDSDKQRGVLPETLGHRTETGDGGCG